MLLTIQSSNPPATDLGFLLHKHPDKHQVFTLPFGKVHVFYPEATEKSCRVAMLLDINPVQLARSAKGNNSGSFQLQHYVNDRPYVNSSFMSTAISKVMGSALNGTCNTHPELVGQPLALEVKLTALPVRGGADKLLQFFEPLGYKVTYSNHLLDPAFPDWGDSPYYNVTLQNQITLQELLSHLYVLIPVLDNNKHYYVGEDEIQKLIDKGGAWLKDHPANALITRRYLGNKKSYTRMAMEQLLGEEELEEAQTAATTEAVLEEKLTLHQKRLQLAVAKLKETGAKSVVDLGCGEGKLLQMLLREKQFEKITGLDISYRSLEIAQRKLHWEEMAPKMKERIELLHGALTYRDPRIEGKDAAVCIEVIEHLDEGRLSAFERVLFEFARPQYVIITTPNKEYNVLFETLPAGQLRHSDHRFEWTRAEFYEWGKRVCAAYDYEVQYHPVGEEDPQHGPPSQMAVFKAKR